MSREGWGATSMTGGGEAGATTGAGVMLGGTAERDGLMVAAATAVGAGALGVGTGICGAGLGAGWTVVESGGVACGTTVSDGRSGAGETTAMISSDLRPSNSAF